MRLALALALVLGSGGSAGVFAPSAIDPSLHAVASTGAHRFLEYRVCSPEHCWSKVFLQWFDREAPERGIAAAAELSELGYGKAVESALWSWIDEQPRLELRVVPSHGGFEPFTLVIKPGLPGQYTSSRK